MEGAAVAMDEDRIDAIRRRAALIEDADPQDLDSTEVAALEKLVCQDVRAVIEEIDRLSRAHARAAILKDGAERQAARFLTQREAAEAKIRELEIRQSDWECVDCGKPQPGLNKWCNNPACDPRTE